MRPKLFVGSSIEGLPVAYAVQQELDADAEITVWTQGVFELSKSSLESLVEVLEGYDYGVFVFRPDDVILMRGKEERTTRDNVVFELGLFIGALGRERTYLVVPRNSGGLHLPTDLLGMTPATFDPERQDGNLRAALGPACHTIREAMKKHGLAPTENRRESEQLPSVQYDENDIIAILASWVRSQTMISNSQVIYFADVDRDAGLPAGSAKKYLKITARRYGYTVDTEGKNTILFKDLF